MSTAASAPSILAASSGPLTPKFTGPKPTPSTPWRGSAS